MATSVLGLISVYERIDVICRADQGRSPVTGYKHKGVRCLGLVVKTPGCWPREMACIEARYRGIDERCASSRISNVTCSTVGIAFVIGLERDYPATVSTIAKTCAKLASRGDTGTQCVLCERYVHALIHVPLRYLRPTSALDLRKRLLKHGKHASQYASWMICHKSIEQSKRIPQVARLPYRQGYVMRVTRP